jgi:glycine cleavage system pyridoxal-binding protein P
MSPCIQHLEILLKKTLLALALIGLPVVSTSLFATQSAMAATMQTKLGDLTAMRKIVADTLTLVDAGNIKGAVKRITEFETAWDKNAKRLKKLDSKSWTKLDDASDIALSTVRYPSATPTEMKKDLADLIAALDNPNL